MGMYNEVYKRCPGCGECCYMQIPQVVLGFGEFDLDNPRYAIADLNQQEKKSFAEYVNQRHFYCNNCSNKFSVKVVVSKEDGNEEIMI
jgi:hypothetical protein